MKGETSETKTKDGINNLDVHREERQQREREREVVKYEKVKDKTDNFHNNKTNSLEEQ